MAGIAVEINMMAWHYGSMFLMATGAIYFFGYMFAHQKYHEVEEDTSASLAEQIDAMLAVNTLE